MRKQRAEEFDYSFNVLQEKVAPTDLFEDKTHERAAETIYRLIGTNHNAVTVGLEGSWGSGKSTVINLLREKLKHNHGSETLFFVFDAWAHDGDPLRKIFLESLISSIDHEEANEPLNSIKNEVSARTKTVNIKTRKSASAFGKILSWSALLIPVGAALLSAIDYEKLSPPWHENSGAMNWTFSLGLGLAFFPAIHFLWWPLWCKYKGRKARFDIFESKSTEDYTQDITEDGERTSIEFEKFFSRILNQVVGPGKKFNQAIFVVDNLDRVEANYAHTLWATLQTFFQHRSSDKVFDNGDWRNHLWFIVPFDRNGLKRIWTKDVEKDHSPNSIIEQNLNDVTATSFIEKCFQVIVEVPIPVMSAWIGYAKYCTDKALLGWPKDSKKEFFDSYLKCMSTLDSSPTPRQIHTIINKVGILGLQWSNAFTPESICIYALCRQTHSESDFRAALLKEGLPNGYPTARSASVVKPELAGLLFGVPPEKGMQLLLAPEIYSALKLGDGASLKELSKVHGEAFWVAWRSSRERWTISPNHSDDYKINATKAIHDAFADQKEHVEQDISTAIESWQQSFNDWNFAKHSFSKTIDYLLNLTEDQDNLLNWLSNKMEEKCRKLSEKIESDDFPETDLENLDELLDFIDSYGHAAKKRRHSNLDLNNWRKWLEFRRGYEVRFYPVLPFPETISGLSQNVGFSQSTLNKGYLTDLIDTLDIDPQSKEWKGVTDQLISWLNMPNREANVDNAYILVKKLMAHRPREETKKLTSCVNSEPFWSRGRSEKLENCPTLPFLAAICDTDFQDSSLVSDSTKKFWSDPEISENELKVLHQKFFTTKNLGLIWILAKDSRNILALELIRHFNTPVLFSCEEGARYIDDIQWHDNNELKQMAQSLCTHGSFDKSKSKISTDVHTYAEVISIFQKNGTHEVKEYIVDLVNKIETSDWETALVYNNALLDCIHSPTHKFSDAYKTFLLGIIQNTLEEYDRNIWGKILDLSKYCLDLERELVPALSQSYFCAENDHLDDIAFEVLSELIQTSPHEIDQDLYDKRIREWIDAERYNRIQWIINQKLSAKHEFTQSLLAKTQEKLDNDTKDNRDLFLRLNEKLSLGLSPSPKVDDTKSPEHHDEQA